MTISIPNYVMTMQIRRSFSFVSSPTAGRAARAVFPMAAALCLLSACTVGPDYRGAPPVAADAMHAPTFVRTPTAGIASAPAPNDWWRMLDDSQLDTLIDAALAHNPNARAAMSK